MPDSKNPISDVLVAYMSLSPLVLLTAKVVRELDLFPTITDPTRLSCLGLHNSVILYIVELGDIDWLETLKYLIEDNPNLPVIVVSGLSINVEAMAYGATDFIFLDNDKIPNKTALVEYLRSMLKDCLEDLGYKLTT